MIYANPRPPLFPKKKSVFFINGEGGRLTLFNTELFAITFSVVNNFPRKIPCVFSGDEVRSNQVEEHERNKKDEKPTLQSRTKSSGFLR